MTFLLFLRQGFSFLGFCCYVNSQRTQLVFTGERLYHISSRRFLCDNKETPGANFPGDHFGPLWTNTKRTCKLCITQILRPHQRSQSLSPEQNIQSLSSHTQTQLECQINPRRYHLSDYNEQYQSKALKPAGIAFTHWETTSVSRSFQLLTATIRLQAPQGQVQKKMIINTQHLVYPTIKHLSGLLNWMMGDDTLHSWKEIGLTDGTIQSTGYWA